jgi:serine/threonine protein kinase/predicted ATPase
LAEFGKYDLLRKIGAGGMAEVFLARSFGAEGLEKLLVIKKILPAFSKNRHFVSMFIDEAKIAVTLSHPNIVQIFEFGQVSRDYYLAMEHIDGVDLGKLISHARRQHLICPPGEAVYICMELAKGLDYAHRKRDQLGEPLDIVHRDVSPQNLLIAREGAVKIVDFGIAKARSISEEEGVVKGKFAYMPPEQARGGSIDHRSDLYAAGVILFELLVGKSPYGVPGAEVNADMVARAEIKRPRDIIPEISQELDNIVTRALARDPDQRYQTARDLQLDLTRYLYSRGEIHDAGTLATFYNRVFPEIEAPSSKGSQSGHSPAPGHLPSPIVSDVVPGLSTPGSSRAGSQAGEPAARMIRKSLIAIHGSIRGFTDLRRTHGEDKVRALMFDYLKILENLAFKSEAIRERVAEDGFTLLLGLPISTAQDPERAIRLAFDLLDATEGINRNVDPLLKEGEKKLTSGLKISIAIARTDVRTEASAGRQIVYEVEPNALDLVQSLAASADANEIRCSSEIWRATRRAYRFQEILQDDVGRCYSVEGALSRAERIREGGTTNLYGRDLAKKAIRDIFREVLLSNQSRTLLISGEIGIGKSALVRSFLSELDLREIKILQGACLYYDVDTPFSPLIELLRDLVQVGESDSIEIIRQKLETELRRLFGSKQKPADMASLEVSGEFSLSESNSEGPSASEQEYEYLLHSFGPLLGVKYAESAMEALDAEQRKMRTILSIQRLFARLARRRAVVIVLEDIHWADSLSIEILEAIAKERYPKKILVVLTSRPTDRIERLTKITPVIELGELELDDRRRLISDLFGEAAPKLQEAVQQIAERVGGNPLFLRETAESTIERGEDIQLNVIPTTIWGVVAARLDELKAEEREALRWAAAVGGAVSPKLIEMSAGTEVSAALPRLVERNLLIKEGDGSFTFRNEITRTVAYEGLPPEERREIHGKIFQSLLIRQNAGAALNPAHLAHHAAQAGETQEAVRLYQAAADRARETYSNREALRLYERALSLLTQDDPERFPIYLHRSRIFSLLSRHSECEEEVAEMVRLSEKLNDPVRTARAYVELARSESDAGRRPQAQKALEVALRTARQAHDVATEAEAVRLAAELFTDLGDLPRGLTLAKRALEIIGTDPTRKRLRSLAMKTLGILLRRSGNVSEAISVYSEALPLAQETNDRALQGQLYNNLGVASQLAGKFEDSLRYFKQGLAIDQEIGNRSSVGIKLGNIGQIYLQLGDFPRALKYLQQAQQIQEAIEETGGLADALTYLARVFLRLTAPRDARAYAEKALRVAKGDGRRYFIGHAQLALAECMLAIADEQDRQKSYELAMEAAKLGEAAPMPDLHAGGLLIAARAQAAGGNLTAARDAIKKSLQVVKTHANVDCEAEIYLHHALLLRGADDEAAQKSLLAAYEIVQKQASHLSDLLRRRSFLEAPPNRDIIAAWQRLRRID